MSTNHAILDENLVCELPFQQHWNAYTKHKVYIAESELPRILATSHVNPAIHAKFFFFGKKLD